MKIKQETYYAKILLFGEYSVIFDSMGLSIPYSHFNGELSFIGEDKYTDLDFAQNSNELLKEYTPYLRQLVSEKKILCEFDLDRFEKDLEKGLYFESSIPQGYGLGSSGALVAALYDSYVKNKIVRSRTLEISKIIELKLIFSQLESFFHGTSSGLDPLNAYIKFPLHIKNKQEIEMVGLPRHKVSTDGAIFLINTGNPGKTQPLVNKFLSKCEDPNYGGLIQNELIALNNSAITNLVNGNLTPFFNNLESISRFQLEHMSYMIPDDFKGVWKQGYETGDYFVKLCGSGGGGFLLGFTKEYSKVKKFFRDQNIEIVTVFKNLKN